MIATNSFTVVSDVLIFALPLPLLWSLKKTSKRDRYAVLAAFMVGFVSTIVAGVRLYSIRVYTLSTEPVREAAPINLWSFIEVNLVLTCVAVIKALIVPSGTRSPMIHGLGFDSTRPSVAEIQKKHQSVTIDEEDSATSRSISVDV
jgi:heme/copper-type cytochrome/quinol oxidase subunit 2